MLNIIMALTKSKRNKILYYNTNSKLFFRDFLKSNGINTFKEANPIVKELREKFPNRIIHIDFV